MQSELVINSTKKVSFDGRILFLCDDAALMQRQLVGEDLASRDAVPLRSDISTDEISPTWITYHFDEKLGDYPYLGLKCGSETPVVAGSVKAGGFAVTVAGRRYGKGSSREASPYAEQCAGIRLVIAESFERIYRQNCHNLGIFTSTDFGLIDRIRRGESIAIDEFTQGSDPVSAELIRRGGLFKLMQARAEGWVLPKRETVVKPMTYAEKIFARASRQETVQVGEALFARTDWRYAHEYNSPLGINALERATGGQYRLHDPSSIIFFADHLTFIHRSMPEQRRKLGMLELAQTLGQTQQRFCAQHGLKLHGFLKDREGSEGISHSIMAEQYVLPGQLVAGTDSHTTHCGALGAVAFGIGSTEMANAWISGEVRVQIPATCRVSLDGVLPRGVEAKDVVLYILSLPYIREGKGIGQIFEFCGAVVNVMCTDDRATLTNMVAEMGGFTGIVVPDLETSRFIRERRQVDWSPESWMCSDAGAEYIHTLKIDCSRLTPMLAQPGDPSSGISVEELRQATLGAPRVDIAYGGSCTGGKQQDLDRVFDVLQWAQIKGLRVAQGTRFILQFGSQQVREHCVSRGMIPVFENAGIELIEPGCGACVNAGPGVSERVDQITISAINRNFPGRSGPGKVWLASPSTVAASALAGEIMSFEDLQKLHNN